MRSRSSLPIRSEKMIAPSRGIVDRDFFYRLRYALVRCVAQCLRRKAISLSAAGADQDRGVHQRYKMRAWPASEGDRLGKREGQVGAFRHEAGLQASGNGGGLSRNGVVKLAVRWRRVL